VGISWVEQVRGAVHESTVTADSDVREVVSAPDAVATVRALELGALRMEHSTPEERIIAASVAREAVEVIPSLPDDPSEAVQLLDALTSEVLQQVERHSLGWARANPDRSAVRGDIALWGAGRGIGCTLANRNRPKPDATDAEWQEACELSADLYRAAVGVVNAHRAVGIGRGRDSEPVDLDLWNGTLSPRVD